MNVSEFIKKTAIPKYNNVVRPHIYCNDGFRLSVQASNGHYCTPRENVDKYKHLEVAYPTTVEKTLMPYADEEREPLTTVYLYVPIEVVDEIIKKHNGIDVKLTFSQANKPLNYK